MDHFPSQEIFKIYNGIRKRKFDRINEIKGIVTPLLLEHPELARVVEIINAWKPVVTEEVSDESSHI